MHVSDLDLGMILVAAEIPTTNTGHQSANTLKCKIKLKIKCKTKYSLIPKITDKENILIKEDGPKKK